MSESEVGNGDKGQLLGIFSAEVWLLILENVKNGADFQRISNASPYFRTLLQPRATQALLPEVLQILTQQQPPLFASGAQLLPLRQVCHAWKSGVEQVLEDPEYHFMFDKEQREKRCLLENNTTYFYNDNSKIKAFDIFHEVEDFTKFQQHFGHGAHWSNPLFCRVVCLNIPPEPQDSAPCFQACLQFLQMYGPHIWYCLIVLDEVELEQHKQFYASGLKQLLELMPNLKMVYFYDINLNDAFLEESLLQQLAQSVENAVTPFPELKQLQMISMRALPLPFLRALVQKNPQVSIVSDTNDILPKEDYLSVYLEQMPNLTAFELKVNNQQDFEAFRRASVNCPLSKLHLNIKWGKVHPWGRRSPFANFAMTMKPLFRVLKTRFSVNLTELSLKFHCKVNSAEKGLKLQLPHLKKLSVTFRNQLIPLDFVLPLKGTLEQLSVGVRFDGTSAPSPPFPEQEARRQDRTVKLYQFWVEPQKSNAWTLFPKLKLLRTIERKEIYSCTREQWIARQPR